MFGYVTFNRIVYIIQKLLFLGIIHSSLVAA